MANKYINKFLDFTTSNLTTAYTCPEANVAMVKSVSVFNNHSGSSDVTVSVQDASSSTLFPYDKKTTLASKAKQEFLEGDASTVLILEESDILKLQSTVTQNIVTISILEQDRT